MSKGKVIRQVLSLCAAIAAVAAANAASAEETIETRVDGVVAELQTATGVEFIAARERARELGRDGAALLSEKLRRASFSRTTWRQDLALAIAHAWAANPNEARKLYQLEGLQPAKYMAMRRPEPEVTRELRRLRAPAAVLFEIALHTHAVYPFAERAAYPQALNDAALAELRNKEQLALRIGVMSAIASSKHPAAGYVLEEVVRDSSAELAVRKAAAIGLGTSQAANALSVLLPIAHDATAPEMLRLGAIAGLGQIRKAASIEALIAIASRSVSTEIRRASIAAIGSAASSWVLRRSAAAGGDELRKRAASALVELLASANGAPDEGQVIEALVMVSDVNARGRLSALATDPGRSEDVRARAQRALERLDRTLARET
jgi:hypothetical protein